MYNVCSIHSIYNNSLDPRQWEALMHTCSIYSSSFTLAAAVVVLVNNALDPAVGGVDVHVKDATSVEGLKPLVYEV